MPNNQRLLAGALALLLLIVSCANPVAPRGGPTDQEPPTVVAMDPANNAVNVTAGEIRIEFSEYVEPASLQRALTITPEFDERLEIRWRGRRATIRFPEPLRPNTTYVLNIDTNLRDVHSVSVKQPITLAFSTGPSIDRGRLSGTVLDAGTGAGLAGYDIYAYPFTDSTFTGSLPERPAYRTQTDATGQFRLDYLNEQQSYFVIALQDQNRNRRPDALEPFGVPVRSGLTADTTSTMSGRWIVSLTDTIPPAVQRLRSLSSSRFELRFDESVLLPSVDPVAWAAADSTAGTPLPIRAVYMLPDNHRQVFIVTNPGPRTPHFLAPGVVTDSSGNALSTNRIAFTPGASADTVAVRFLGFEPGSPADSIVALAPGRPPGLRFNQTLLDIPLTDLVQATDTSGAGRPFTATTINGSTYLVSFDPPLKPGELIQLRVNTAPLRGSDTLLVRTFRLMAPRDLGGLIGTVRTAGVQGNIVIELYAVGNTADTGVRRVTPGPDGRFTFPNLPAGRYRLRLFLDQIANGRWDPGSISPYVAAEPVTWSADSLNVQPRWDTELADTLRFPASE